MQVGCQRKCANLALIEAICDVFGPQTCTYDIGFVLDMQEFENARLRAVYAPQVPFPLTLRLVDRPEMQGFLRWVSSSRRVRKGVLEGKNEDLQTREAGWARDLP